MLTTALYAGSFDPLTNGHFNIICRASKIFDSLTVGIISGSKNNLFSSDERQDMVRHATSDMQNVKVESFNGLLADYVNSNKFNFVIRGLRATTDFEYEIQMAQMNARLYEYDTETVFLMTDPKYSFISSSLIKEVASYGGNVHGLLPSYAEEMLKAKRS